MIEQYKSNGYKIAQINSNDPRWHLEFPNIVRMGKSILIDSYNDDSNRPTPYTHSRQNSFREQINKFIKPIFTDIEWVEDGGHWDSMMCIMKPGYLLYSHWLQSQFSDTTLDQHLSKRFFNWKKDLVHKKNIPGNGKWWTAETNYQNATFNHYVMEKAKNWIGDSSETVFEVNMLVIDEQNVICINENDKVFKQLEANGITPHVVNFPTRHFWDGGWHCNTLDIRRKGNQENYFSE